MKKKNILLLVYESDVNHIITVAKIFSKTHNIYFLCADLMTSNSENNVNINQIKKSGLSFKFLNDFRSEIISINKKINKKKILINWNFLRKIEKNYLGQTLNNIIFRDFSFNEVDHHRGDYFRPENKLLKIKLIEIISKKILKIFKTDFDLIYSGGRSNFVRNFVYEYCKQNKIKYIFPQRRLLNLTYIEDSQVKYLNKFNNLSLNKNQKITLDKFKNYKNLNKLSIKKINMNLKKVKFIKELVFIIYNLKKFFNYYRDHRKNRLNYNFSNLYYEKDTFKIFFLHIRNAIRRKKIVNILLKDSYEIEKKLKSINYFYFPLHTIPEDGIFNEDVYESQFNLVRKLIKFLPINFKLIVKPHPKNFRYLSSIEHPSFYSKIAKVDNVILANYTTDHYKLIKNSSCVVTITGTSALEANLYDIDSLIFAKTNYSNLAGMYDFSQKSIKEIINQINVPKNYFQKNLNYYKFLSKFGVESDLVDFLFVDHHRINNEDYISNIRKLLKRFI